PNPGWCNLSLSRHEKKPTSRKHPPYHGGTGRDGGDMRKTACILLALCMAACNNGDDIKTGQTAQRHALLSEPAFAFDAQEFADAFNTAARRHGSSFRIDHIDVRHGAVHDYFQQVFGAGMSLTAGISKESGCITSVTALVNGNDADADRQKLLILARS